MFKLRLKEFSVQKIRSDPWAQHAIAPMMASLIADAAAVQEHFDQCLGDIATTLHRANSEYKNACRVFVSKAVEMGLLPPGTAQLLSRFTAAQSNQSGGAHRREAQKIVLEAVKAIFVVVSAQCSHTRARRRMTY